MKRIIGIAIPVVILAFFIFIMLSTSYLKQSRGDFDNVLKIVSEIKNNININDWEQAKSNINKLESAWNHITKRVQFSAEREEIMRADSSIARAKGFIEGKDRPGTLSELNEVKEHWDNLGR